MPNDAAVAAPSAAASETVLSVPTNSADYGKWRTTGELPTKTEKPAASPDQPTKRDDAAPSKKSEASAKKAEPEHSPEPEPEHHEPARRGKASAAERTDQLRKENEELQKELDRRAKLRKELAVPDEGKDDKKAEPSTAQPSGDLKPPVKPKASDFTGEDAWEKYEEAKDEYHDKMTDYKVAIARAEERQRQAQEESAKRTAQQVEDARKRYTDLDVDKIESGADKLLADKDIHVAVKQTIARSPVYVDLMYTMTSDPEEFTEFLELSKRDPIAAVKKLAVTEHLIRESLEQGKSTTKETPARDENGKFQPADKPERQVPEKKVTEALEPPEEVGSRASKPPDEVDKAARTNDFRAFRAAQNQRDLQRRRGL